MQAEQEMVDTKVKKKKKLAVVKEEAAVQEPNIFLDPDAALVDGSAEQLAVLKGNHVEEPEDADLEDTEETKALRQKIQTLQSDRERLFWDLAEPIAKVANEKIYKRWGYSTFEQYVNEECHTSKRSAQYYVQVYNYFFVNLKTVLINKQQAHKELVEAVKRNGSTKARILAREQIIVEDNVEEVMDRLNTCTVKDLEQYCAIARDSLKPEQKEKAVEDNNIKMVPMNFKLMLEQHEDVEAALECAKVTLNERKKLNDKDASNSQALTWICRDFKSTHLLSAGGKVNLAEYLSNAERFFGVTLVAFDEAADTIVYGKAALERLAK